MDKMDMEKLKRFAELAKAKEKANADLDAIKTEMAELEPELLEVFIENETTQIKIADRTIYVDSRIFASAIDQKELCAYMTEEGFGDMVKEAINGNTLSSYVREFERDEEGVPVLPDGLKGLVKVSLKDSLKVRKG
ncbi:MAG: hypothetical protein JXD22_11570 [Sedimentisphaerales bacterium]|nr:hypothetical protein [Sedimentisphaerales bacterium]